MKCTCLLLAEPHGHPFWLGPTATRPERSRARSRRSTWFTGPVSASIDGFLAGGRTDSESKTGRGWGGSDRTVEVLRRGSPEGSDGKKGNKKKTTVFWLVFRVEFVLCILCSLLPKQTISYASVTPADCRGSASNFWWFSQDEATNFMEKPWLRSAGCPKALEGQHPAGRTSRRKSLPSSKSTHKQHPPHRGHASSRTLW